MEAIQSSTAGLNLERGLIYIVEFDDGSTRRMRDLAQKVNLCHAWLDLASEKVVTLCWLAAPCGSKKGPNAIAFCNPDVAEDFTHRPWRDNPRAAFGGAIVARMDLDIEVGRRLSWVSQASGGMQVKTGVVEEVVHAGEFPDRERFPQLYKSRGVGAPRMHISYVLRVPGKSPKAVGKVYWPRVTSLTCNSDGPISRTDSLGASDAESGTHGPRRA